MDRATRRRGCPSSLLNYVGWWFCGCQFLRDRNATWRRKSVISGRCNAQPEFANTFETLAVPVRLQETERLHDTIGR